MPPRIWWAPATSSLMWRAKYRGAISVGQSVPSHYRSSCHLDTNILAAIKDCTRACAYVRAGGWAALEERAITAATSSTSRAAYFHIRTRPRRFPFRWTRQTEDMRGGEPKRKQACKRKTQLTSPARTHLNDARWMWGRKWILVDARHPLFHYLQVCLIIPTFSTRAPRRAAATKQIKTAAKNSKWPRFIIMEWWCAVERVCVCVCVWESGVFIMFLRVRQYAEKHCRLQHSGWP